MEKASEILIIIVSSALTLFLLVGIVALVKFAQVLSSLKRITAKAERLAESAEAVGDFFRKSAEKADVWRLISKITDKVKDHKD